MSLELSATLPTCVCLFVCFLVFDWVEQYAPGFKSSVIGRDILAPPDLEKIFGLSGGVCMLHSPYQTFNIPWLRKRFASSTVFCRFTLQTVTLV